MDQEKEKTTAPEDTEDMVDEASESAPESPSTEGAAESTAEKREDKKKKKKEKKEELEKLQAQLDEEKDQHLRLRAEYQNYRNRTSEEKKKIYGDAKADCVKDLLQVMDTFERAMETPCSDESYKKGIEQTFKQMQKAFETMGITEIAPELGETFDPKWHNAIKQVDDSEYESDTVCEVFQKGYMLGDRQIRPAMVAVAV